MGETRTINLPDRPLLGPSLLDKEYTYKEELGQQLLYKLLVLQVSTQLSPEWPLPLTPVNGPSLYLHKVSKVSEEELKFFEGPCQSQN